MPFLRANALRRCAAGLLLFTCTVSAQSPLLPSTSESPAFTPAPLPTALEARGFRLEVVDETGTPIPQANVNGYRRTVLDPSHAYALRLTNLSESRMLAVIAINQRDPATGRKAYLAQPGWVLDRGQSRLVRAGKTHRKAASTPVLPAAQGQGHVAVAVFAEDPSYPFLVPGMDVPPFGPKTYRVGADGIRRWVPPEDYPFRKASVEPEIRLYLEYQTSPPE